MYTLQKVLDDLYMGELSQIGLSINDRDSDCDSYDKHAIKTIVSHLNLALIELYTKFPLLEKEVIVQQYSSITMYRLNSAFAQSNTESTMNPKYIIDTPENPFKDDILRIESVYNEMGKDLPLNEPNKDDSIFTPDYLSVQMPNPEEENSVAIVYRASHPNIEYTGDVIPSAIMVSVPPYLYQALLVYIAYRVNKARSAANSQQDAMSNLQLFNLLCSEVETRNMTNNDNVYDTAVFTDNGWI